MRTRFLLLLLLSFTHSFSFISPQSRPSPYSSTPLKDAMSSSSHHSSTVLRLLPHAPLMTKYHNHTVEENFNPAELYFLSQFFFTLARHT